jgi:hypothetical protein
MHTVPKPAALVAREAGFGKAFSQKSRRNPPSRIAAWLAGSSMSLNAGIGETGIAPEADLLIIFTHC